MCGQDHFDEWPYGDEPGDEHEPMVPHTVIEYPASSETYGPHVGDPPQYGVYRYSEYELSSVLAGQVKRENLGMYDTLEEAREEHPDAEWHEDGAGPGYPPAEAPMTPPKWFDPANAGEAWGEEDY